MELALLIPYPDIGTVAFRIGPVAIRWYALAYVVGLMLAWWYVRRVAEKPLPKLMAKRDVDDLLMWATLGVVFGGRLGYVIFYKPGYYIDNLGEVLSLWRGGMSFHGGMLGVILAAILFARGKSVV